MEANLACFQMLSQHLGMPFRRDVLKRALNSFERSGSIFQLCGAIAELMGLNSQLVNVPAAAVTYNPAMLRWQDSFALLIKLVKRTGSSFETGIRRIKPAASSKPGEKISAAAANHQRHSQAAVWPGLVPSSPTVTAVLLEVLIASFFVQLFGLANPNHPSHYRQGSSPKQY